MVPVEELTLETWLVTNVPLRDIERLHLEMGRYDWRYP